MRETNNSNTKETDLTMLAKRLLGLNMNTTYKRSLANLSTKGLDLNILNDDLIRIKTENCVELLNIAKDFNTQVRLKSINSIMRKIYRYTEIGNKANLVFNDIIGFRIICNSYNNFLKMKGENIRVYDYTHGKNSDDGYRAVHIYIQKDNYSYPIEIQVWSKYDSVFNNWMHTYGYKTLNDTELLLLFNLKEKGIICDFKSYMEHVEVIRDAKNT